MEKVFEDQCVDTQRFYVMQRCHNKTALLGQTISSSYKGKEWVDSRFARARIGSQPVVNGSSEWKQLD